MEAPLRRALAHIIEEDELPPNLLTQVRNSLQQHQEADDLYEWMMKLAPHLHTRDVRTIGFLLKNVPMVLDDIEEPPSEPIVTLSKGTRRTIRELSKNGKTAAGPATSVIGFDAIARAYNRAHTPRPTTRD